MQAKKTHEQQLRMLERKPDVPDARRMEAERGQVAGKAARTPHRDGRQATFAVSRGGLNQESRDHNKHNHRGQSGHKPQRHRPAEEKH